MSFLMGLSNFFTQVRGNILLMDPLPEGNRVFHLVSQEANQRGYTTASTDPSPAMAFSLEADKSSYQKPISQGSKIYPLEEIVLFACIVTSLDTRWKGATRYTTTLLDTIKTNPKMPQPIRFRPRMKPVLTQ